jgi:photosystem II stability/assembly factor-like uncharacterized protein
VRRSLVLCLIMGFIVSGCAGQGGKPTTSSAPPVRLTAIHFVDAKHGWLAGINTGCGDPTVSCQGTMYYTDDGGSHWTQRYEGDVAPLSLSFVSPQTGWAAGGSALLKTTDGGRTWVPIYTAAEGALLSIQFLDPENGWMTNNDGKLFQTRDGGRHWKPVSIACADWVSFVDARTGFVLCGLPRNPGPGMMGKSMWRTTDGGEHWTVVDSVSEPQQQRPGGLPFAGYGSGFHFRTAADGWIALSRAGLVHSQDGGKSWHLLVDDLFHNRTPVLDGVDFSEATAVQFLTASRGYAIVGRTFLVTTDDGGRTWRIIFSPTIAQAVRP